MEVVQNFNRELKTLLDHRPPVSRQKMSLITKAAMRGLKFYKHVVQSVEKFIQKCNIDYKVPGLYVVDAIVRQSRHQYGAERDVFAPRFMRNLLLTFQHLYQCDDKDKPLIIRVLNLWLKGEVFPIDVIQVLLDLAEHPLDSNILSRAQQIIYRHVVEYMARKDGTVPGSIETTVPMLALTYDQDFYQPGEDLIAQSSPDVSNDAGGGFQHQNVAPGGGLISSIAALLQRFADGSGQDTSHYVDRLQLLHTQVVEQSSRIAQGEMIDQEVLQELHAIMLDLQRVARDAYSKQQKLQALSRAARGLVNFDYDDSDTEEPETQAESQGIEPDLLDQLAQMTDTLAQTQALQEELRQARQQAAAASAAAQNICEPTRKPLEPLHDLHSQHQTVPIKMDSHEMKLSSGMQVFDYGHSQHQVSSNKLVDLHSPLLRRHANQSRDLSATDLEEGEVDEDSGCLSDVLPNLNQAYAESMTAVSRISRDRQQFAYQHEQTQHQQPRHNQRVLPSPPIAVDFDLRRDRDERRDPRDRRASAVGGALAMSAAVNLKERSRSPIVRERDNNRRQHSSQRSRSREIDHPRDSKQRSKERKEREREHLKERRKKGLPLLKDRRVSVVSTTVWVGKIHKHTTEKKLRDLLEEFGAVDELFMIPPRGCAYVVYNQRKAAARAVRELQRVTLDSSLLKVAFAPNKGVKDSNLKEFWDVEEGATYVPFDRFPKQRWKNLLAGGAQIDEESVPLELTDLIKAAAEDDEQDEDSMKTKLLLPITAPPPLPAGMVPSMFPNMMPPGMSGMPGMMPFLPPPPMMAMAAAMQTAARMVASNPMLPGPGMMPPRMPDMSMPPPNFPSMPIIGPPPAMFPTPMRPNGPAPPISSIGVEEDSLLKKPPPDNIDEEGRPVPSGPLDPTDDNDYDDVQNGKDSEADDLQIGFDSNQRNRSDDNSSSAFVNQHRDGSHGASNFTRPRGSGGGFQNFAFRGGNRGSGGFQGSRPTRGNFDGPRTSFEPRFGNAGPPQRLPGPSPGYRGGRMGFRGLSPGMRGMRPQRGNM